MVTSKPAAAGPGSCSWGSGWADKARRPWQPQSRNPKALRQGGTATQENPELEVRGRKPEPNWEAGVGTGAGPSPHREGPGGSRLEVWWEEGSTVEPTGWGGGKRWGRELGPRCGRWARARLFLRGVLEPSCLDTQRQIHFNLWNWGPCAPSLSLRFPFPFQPLLFSSPRSLPFNPYASTFLFSHLWVPTASFPLDVSVPLLRPLSSLSSLSIPPTLSCLHSSSLTCPALLPKLRSSHLLLCALCLHSPFPLSDPQFPSAAV